MKLMTRNLKIDEITEDKLKTLISGVIENYDLKEEDVEYVVKGIPTTDTKIDKTERSVISYINTAARDRDNEIIVPKGAMMADYKKNPVVMFCHNYSMLPVGKNLWIKFDGNGLVAKTQYAKHQKAEEVYQYRSDGFPLAESIGFIPVKMVRPADLLDEDLVKLGLDPVEARKASLIYTKWILLEYSDVPVPANPEALQLAVTKGLISQEEAKLYEVELDGYEITIVEEKGVSKITVPDDKGGEYEFTAEDLGQEVFDKLLKDVNDPEAIEAVKGLILAQEKAKYDCECIKCGHKLSTDKHCKEVKCPKCGGTMRRLERPGPGENAVDNEEDDDGVTEDDLTIGMGLLDNTTKLFNVLKLDLGGLVLATKNPESIKLIETFSGFLLEKLANINKVDGDVDDEPKLEDIEIELDELPDISGDQVKNIISNTLKELVSETELVAPKLVSDTIRKLQGKVD